MADLITLTNAASAIGVSRTTMKRYAYAQRVPFIKLPGGHFRFDPDELSEWVRSRKTMPRGTFRTPRAQNRRMAS